MTDLRIHGCFQEKGLYLRQGPADRPPGCPHPHHHVVPQGPPGVVQTCMLAKRWRHLWRSVPFLDIDLPEFNSKVSDEAAIKARYQKFVDFVDYLLFHRHQDGALLDTFRLHTNAAHTPIPEDAGRWVRRGLWCSPRVLHIHHSFGRYGRTVACIPWELVSGPSGFCRLSKLHLVGLFLKCSFVEQVISVYHTLEELELKNCQILFQKIESPSLKSLIIDGCGTPYVKNLIITAPHLASVHLDLKPYGYDFVVFELNEMLSLTKASIHNRSSYQGDPVHDNQFKLLSSLSNVTSLELLGFHRRLLPDEEPVEFPAFKNLTSLLLDDCKLGDKFQLLRHFLQNSPNLERLIVKCCQFSKASKRGKGKAKSKTSSQCQVMVHLTCLKLKCIEITYEHSDNIGALVNVLLDVSDLLPKNTIRLTKVEATE